MTIGSSIQLLSQHSIDSLSTFIIQKVATAMRCNCGHLWLTTSKSKYPTCPRCHVSISRKKHAVIIEPKPERQSTEEGP